MKSTLVLISILLTCTTNAQTAISIDQAKNYISKVNQVLSTDQFYLRASAKSYSTADPVNPSDIGECFFARKGNCTYQNFKGLITYSNKTVSVQIDTLYKTLLVSAPEKFSIPEIRQEDFNQCRSISLSGVKSNVCMLIFKMNADNQYDQIEIVFDTLQNKLIKAKFIYADASVNVKEFDIKRIEIEYHEITIKVPEKISVCKADDIIRVKRNHEVEIKIKIYQEYTLINLFEN